jgi:hypothetical protein
LSRPKAVPAPLTLSALAFSGARPKDAKRRFRSAFDINNQLKSRLGDGEYPNAVAHREFTATRLPARGFNLVSKMVNSHHQGGNPGPVTRVQGGAALLLIQSPSQKTPGRTPVPASRSCSALPNDPGGAWSCKATWAPGKRSGSACRARGGATPARRSMIDRYEAILVAEDSAVPCEQHRRAVTTRRTLVQTMMSKGAGNGPPGRRYEDALTRFR